MHVAKRMSMCIDGNGNHLKGILLKNSVKDFSFIYNEPGIFYLCKFSPNQFLKAVPDFCYICMHHILGIVLKHTFKY